MIILENYLKALKLPTFVKRYKEVAEACQKKGFDYAQFLLQLSEMEVLEGISVYFITAASLVHELMEAREEKQLLRLQKKLNHYPLLIIDELGFVPFSKTGAELLFEIFSNRYERGSVLITSNLPFQEWTQMFGCERLTGALLDRLTHHVHILEMNGESYRLTQSKKSQKP